MVRVEEKSGETQNGRARIFNAAVATSVKAMTAGTSTTRQSAAVAFLRSVAFGRTGAAATGNGNLTGSSMTPQTQTPVRAAGAKMWPSAPASPAVGASADADDGGVAAGAALPPLMLDDSDAGEAADEGAANVFAPSGTPTPTAAAEPSWLRQRFSSKDQAALGFLSSIATAPELAARRFSANDPQDARQAAMQRDSAGIDDGAALSGGPGATGELAMGDYDDVAAAAAAMSSAAAAYSLAAGDEFRGRSLSTTAAPGVLMLPAPTYSGRQTPRTSTFQSRQQLIIRGDVFSRQRLGSPASLLEQMSDVSVTLTTPKGSPMTVFSFIPYRDAREKVKKQRARARYSVNPYLERIGLSLAMDVVKRKKPAESFAYLLEPAHSLSPYAADNSIYNPYFLDDPELKMGRHKTVITLPCFLGTIIQPSKPSEIKRELNEHFRESHPGIDASLTLSQIRNLKAKLLEIALIQELELSSAASAFVYFEKLVLRGDVTKANRKLIGAVCLLLAAKVNDPKELNYAKLLETTEKVLDVPPKDVYSQEFFVYTALEFTLFLPLWEVMPHLERILELTKHKNAGSSVLEGHSFFV